MSSPDRLAEIMSKRFRYRRFDGDESDLSSALEMAIDSNWYRRTFHAEKLLTNESIHYSSIFLSSSEAQDSKTTTYPSLSRCTLMVLLQLSLHSGWETSSRKITRIMKLTVTIDRTPFVCMNLNAMYRRTIFRNP